MQVQAWEIEWVTRKVNDWMVKSFLLYLYMPGNCNGGVWKTMVNTLGVKSIASFF